MQRAGFCDYLGELEIPQEQVGASLESVADFESWLDRGSWQDSGFSLSASDVERYSKHCISRGTNTWEHYMALVLYARYLRHDLATRWFIELLDGSEVMDNLYKKVGEELGTEVRQKIFQDLELPSLGTPNREKAPFTQVVMQRMQSLCGAQTCQLLLEDCLRDLSDTPHLKERSKYEACENLDEYLRLRGGEYIAELEALQAEGSLYFTQPITEEVLAFVRANPEISHSVRRGNILYKVKIPYLTAEYLAETDEQLKRYYYCHCPWARESILDEDVEVTPCFCNCSAGYMKKPWEVIFGQPLHAEMVESVLAGDECCRVAIHLPEGV